MPWTVKDVDKHKKGLSPAQKKKWVETANGVYRSCMVNGDDKTCTPKAIRIANSKFSEEPMKKETVKLQKNALCFSEGTAKLAAPEEGKERLLQMEAYSGGIIKDHFWWGDLAIDVSGMKMTGKIPILQDHDTSKKVGFGKFAADEKCRVVPTDSKFLDTEFANEFIKLSDEGFPYQASIYARPTKIQRLMEKEEAEVNGFTMKGPGTIWRESVLKECSIVTFGADPNTKSAAMSETEDVDMFVEQHTEDFKEEEIMDLTKFKSEHPDLYAQVVALGRTEAETAFSEVKSGLETQIATLSAEKEKLSEQNEASEARLLKLERAEILRHEQEMKFSADKIFSEALSATSIPERLHGKVRKQLDHQKFIDANGDLDKTAFKEAIAAELKDWVSEEGEDESVLGFGMSRKPSEQFTETDSDAIVNRMLGHVGQKLQ
jgi:hypothetical protein